MMPRKQDEPNYYAILPADVRYDKKLPPYARLLYAEITSLCNKKGYCWASNSYFSALYDVDRSSISHWIKKLVGGGYITVRYVHADGKPNIEERQIFLTGNILLPKKTSKTDDAGGGDVVHQGGEIGNQGGGDINHQGGEIRPERILKANNKAAAADQNSPQNEKYPPPEKTTAAETVLAHDFECLAAFNAVLQSLDGENVLFDRKDTVQTNSDPPKEVSTPDISGLKQSLKSLNPKFVFDERFYRKAYVFLTSNRLDSGYISWMYEFCTKRKPDNLSGYFFKVFCEPRYIELYREASRPPPVPEVKIIPCPVCGKEHNIRDSSCPTCGLDQSFRHDAEKIAWQKRLHALPEDLRAAFEAESDKLFDTHPADNLSEMRSRFRNLKEKYGLV